MWSTENKVGNFFNKKFKVEYSVLYVGVANCVVTGLVPLTLLFFLNLVIKIVVVLIVMVLDDSKEADYSRSSGSL